MNTRLLLTLAFCGLLALTNRWLSFEDGIEILKAADTRNYMTLALGAPALPTQPVASNHAVRIALPYALGTVAHYTGVSPQTLFLIATLALCGVIIALLHFMLQNLDVSDTQYAILMASFILNPYTFRYYLAVPAMAVDLVFVSGQTLLLWGLMRRNFWLTLAGGALGILGRQNALIVLPAAAAWMLWSEGWRSEPLTKRAIQCAALVAITVLLYKIEGWVIASFAVQGIESATFTGFATWIGSETPGKIKILVEYGVRSVLCFLFPFCMAFGVIAARKRAGANVAETFRRLPREFWLLLLFVGALFSFSYLGNPELFMSGVTRYSSHALVALTVALALVFREFGAFRATRDVLAFALGNVVAMASFHHMTTFGGTTSDKALYFSTIYAMCALGAGALSYAVALRESVTNE